MVMVQDIFNVLTSGYPLGNSKCSGMIDFAFSLGDVDLGVGFAVYSVKANVVCFGLGGVVGVCGSGGVWVPLCTPFVPFASAIFAARKARVQRCD